jgi:tight adherence protein B
MSGALLAAALAVLFWPDRRTARRRRLREVTGIPAAAARRRGFAELPVPLTAALLSAAVAAVLSTPLVAGLTAGTAFLGARSWDARHREQRDAARMRHLTEGLGALAADLRSGRSLDAATEAAVEACADAEGGAALARALRNPGGLPPVHPDPEFGRALARVSAGVLLSARTGCSLTAITAAVEDDLRARQRHRLELRTATSGPRASAMLLAGLPVLGLAMGGGMGADPWTVLTTTGPGQVLLVAGALLELAGLSWSARLVRRALR